MSHASNVISNMIEVNLVGGPEGFRKVKETLTRMGVATPSEKTLSQSAHILHSKGRYFICHFKEMFLLDGLASSITESDLARRNRIAQMLSDWNLIQVVDPKSLEPMGSPSVVKIIKHSEKDDWQLIPKYTMGKTLVTEGNFNE